MLQYPTPQIPNWNSKIFCRHVVYFKWRKWMRFEVSMGSISQFNKLLLHRRLTSSLDSEESDPLKDICTIIPVWLLHAVCQFDYAAPRCFKYNALNDYHSVHWTGKCPKNLAVSQVKEPIIHDLTPWKGSLFLLLSEEKLMTSLSNEPPSQKQEEARFR